MRGKESQIRSDNFLICYLLTITTVNPGESHLMSFSKICSCILRHTSPHVCTTKRRRMEHQRAGTQGFGAQGNIKLLALRLKYRDFQNVKNSGILRMTSRMCSALLILTLSGNISIFCFWIASGKSGNEHVEQVVVQSLWCVFPNQWNGGNNLYIMSSNCFKLELRFCHILKR